MATKYCDHGAYGAYAATPTWGVPQDGDGLAKDASTASATCSIVFTGIPAGTISVCGVTVSPTWATSANVSADNLATAINAATSNVTTTGFRSAAVQLRNAVFARGPSTGAPSGTCQIMTRHGSAVFNGLTAIAHTLTNVDGGASSLTFSGGVSGCWGWVFNPTAVIWASAVAIAGYGIWAAAMPYAGSMDAGDIVKVRSNKTITLPANINVTWTLGVMGSAIAPVCFVIDDSTEWSDGADPVLKITEAFTGNYAMIFSSQLTSYAHILAKKYSSGQRNLVLEATGNGPMLTNIKIVSGGSPVRFENIDFYCPGTPATSSCSASAWVSTGASSLAVTSFFGCRWVWPGNAGSARFIDANTANGQYQIRFIGCEFVQTAPTVAQIVTLLNSGGSSYRFEFYDCKFIGFVSGSVLYSASALNTGSTFSFHNCDFGNVTNRGPSVATISSGSHSADCAVAHSKLGNREFFIDGRAGFAEWNYSKNFPTLNARLPDGTTPWSIFATPSTVATNLGKLTPFELPAIAKINTLTSGDRTVTLNLLLESTLTWTKQDISVQLSYVDSSGAVVVIDTYDPAATALSTTTEAWTNTSYNGKSWNKKAFSFTATALANGSEITAIVRLHTAVANNTLAVFVDPELVIS